MDCVMTGGVTARHKRPGEETRDSWLRLELPTKKLVEGLSARVQFFLLGNSMLG